MNYMIYFDAGTVFFSLMKQCATVTVAGSAPCGHSYCMSRTGKNQYYINRVSSCNILDL